MSNQGTSVQFFSSLLAGSIIGSLQISFVLAYATILFGQDLSPFLGQGIGILLTGTFVSVFILALLSSYSGSIGSAQDIPATLLSIMIANISINFLQKGEINSSSFDTAVTLLIVTTLITSFILILMAKFKLGKVIRLIPFPILGGLLASTGWMLSMVAFSMLVNETISYKNIEVLFSSEVIYRWIPGMAVALTIIVASRKLKSSLTLPIIIFLSFIIAHIALWYFDISISEAKELGILLNIESKSLVFGLNIVDVVSSADINLVLSQLPLIIGLCFLSVIIVMVQVSSIEVVIGKEMNMNKELFANGLANLGAGLAGGLISYHHISNTTIAYRLGARTRVVGIISAVCCLLPFWFGTQWLGYLPVPVLAGIILYLGLDFLYEWIFLSKKQLPIWEYITLIIIFLTVILFNFPLGIAVGVICGIALFVIRSSNINIIDRIITDEECKSVVVRSPQETLYLDNNGKSIALIKLKGHMFFGTANSLFEQISNYITEDNQSIKTIVLDFKSISQIDYSAIVGLLRIRRLLHQKQIQLFFADVPPENTNLIEKALSDSSESNTSIFYTSADQAIEAAENALLLNVNIDFASEYTGFDSLLLSAGFNQNEISIIRDSSIIHDTENEESISNMGDLQKSFYIIDEGEIAIYQVRGNKKVRLRVLRSGMVVGEMALYSGLPRSADIVSYGKAKLMEINEDSLSYLEENHSKIAFKVHRLLGKRLSQMVLDDSILQTVRT